MRQRMLGFFSGFPSHHFPLEIAEKLQIKFEQGRLLTISKDGTSAKGSHMGRSGYIIANRLKMWCHTVLLLDELVVDLWRTPTVMPWKDFWEKIGAENLGTELKIFDEDSQEEVTEELRDL